MDFQVSNFDPNSGSSDMKSKNRPSIVRENKYNKLKNVAYLITRAHPKKNVSKSTIFWKKHIEEVTTAKFLGSILAIVVINFLLLCSSKVSYDRNVNKSLKSK